MPMGPASSLDELYPAGPAPPPDATERRGGPRHSVIVSRAFLAWWAGPRPRSEDARLLDIGPGGALVEVDSFPPRLPLLLGLRDAPPGAAQFATVVRSGRGRRHAHRLHLAFEGPCPEDLIRWAVHGLPARRPWAAGPGASL
jgi:hypothetical protein